MDGAMTKLLSEDAIEQYRRDGYYVPVSVLDPNEAAATRRALKNSVAEHGGKTRVLRAPTCSFAGWRS